MHRIYDNLCIMPPRSSAALLKSHAADVPTHLSCCLQMRFNEQKEEVYICNIINLWITVKCNNQPYIHR